MDDLTQSEIEQIYKTAYDAELEKTFCLILTRLMLGWLRIPSLDKSDFENTRQLFFQQIKRHLDEKELTRQGNRSSKGSLCQ